MYTDLKTALNSSKRYQLHRLFNASQTLESGYSSTQRRPKQAGVQRSKWARPGLGCYLLAGRPFAARRWVGAMPTFRARAAKGRARGRSARPRRGKGVGTGKGAKKGAGKIAYRRHGSGSARTTLEPEVRGLQRNREDLQD